MSGRFDPSAADRRWQARWEEENCFAADSGSNKPKTYVLEMFPYPSGRIHMGHVRNYTMGDVIANEQVIDGKGWRSGADVERRKLSQWFLKITDFAENLLDGLKTLDDWPEKVRLMQENWIGKSKGLDFAFQLAAPIDSIDSVEVFTTRPDTIFGASFVAIAASHPLAQAIAANDSEAAKFIAECQRGGTSLAEIEAAEKKGFRTSVEVVHPLDPQWRLPVYIANFVLMDYGTGAIFGVPGHDQRDFEFATKYGLPIRRVVAAGPELASEPIGEEAESSPGVAVNSKFLDGLTTEQASAEVIRRAEAAGWGRGTVQYRLRDWGVSRQRYWGTPIPIVHCANCGPIAVPREQLPVVLPDDIEFDKPGNPLDRHPTWKHVACPDCGGPATRETDTLDTFVDSSWYFIRFASQPADRPFDRAEAEAWLPVVHDLGCV